MRISVLVLDGAFDTGLAAVLDAFAVAGELDPDAARFDVSCIGVRARVKTQLGFLAPVVPPPARAPDLVVVPALGCKTPDTIVAALDRPDVADAIALVQRWHAAGARVAAACTGTFVLGRSGLLDGRRATTSWWLGPTFRREFPAVDLDDGTMIVADGRFVTAGAALAHLDLALSIVRQRSPTLAALVARYLLVDDRPSQAPFVVPDHVAYDDELVKRFETWTRRHLAEPFDLGRAARAVGASERTLQRRIRVVLGKPPIGFVQSLRLERAVHLLRSTHDTVDAIASSVGYEDASTLRTLLRRKLQTGVRELRTRAE